MLSTAVVRKFLFLISGFYRQSFRCCACLCITMSEIPPTHIVTKSDIVTVYQRPGIQNNPFKSHKVYHHVKYPYREALIILSIPHTNSTQVPPTSIESHNIPQYPITSHSHTPFHQFKAHPLLPSAYLIQTARSIYALGQLYLN